ncbi:hypothetical protein QF012_001998 [Pseudomonas laurylsulfatiphila]
MTHSLPNLDTALTQPIAHGRNDLVDRYPERKESAQALPQRVNQRPI